MCDTAGGEEVVPRTEVDPLVAEEDGDLALEDVEARAYSPLSGAPVAVLAESAIDVLVEASPTKA